MRSGGFGLVVLAACSGKGDDPGADTGSTGGLDCDGSLVPVAIEPCAETTAAVDPAPTYTTTDVHAVAAGTITEVGGALTAVPDSVPIGFLPACSGGYPHQVRLVDDLGETWTVGWRIDDPIAADSAEALAVGEAVTIRVDSEFLAYSSSWSAVLADAVGPLFLVEHDGRLSDEERGGISVAVDSTDVCLQRQDGYDVEHYLVTFGWDGGEVALRTGQSAVLGLPDRDVELVLGRSDWLVGCADGCGTSEWAYWAEAP